MVNYYVISKNEKAVGQGGETLYGVCACTLHDGVMEVQNCIYGISGDLAWLKTLRGTEIELQAQALFNDIVMRLSEEENVTENLKATDPMEWVKRSNNIRNRATEIVNAEVIFV